MWLWLYVIIMSSELLYLSSHHLWCYLNMRNLPLRSPSTLKHWGLFQSHSHEDVDGLMTKRCELQSSEQDTKFLTFTIRGLGTNCLNGPQHGRKKQNRYFAAELIKKGLNRIYWLLDPATSVYTASSQKVRIIKGETTAALIAIYSQYQTI
jgi:hypothetical protein